ncbi:MAG: queuosine precursor transporter [Crocinitomicaceae bacterium]|nr:queuosine precursor transporter [Crocinitomicaceae bacterium]MDP4760268.1 queuosine precursor transporter [Crocinitomicaceae bacterium]
MKAEKLNERRYWLFIILAGLFVTNAVTAELISNKLIQIPIEFTLFGSQFGPFATIVGILPWPVVFLLTDLMNEFYGQKAVRRLSWITAGLIAYCFIIVGISLAIPAYEIKGSDLADNASYLKVFGQSQMIIVGSICAFLVSQLLDAFLFDKIKHKTGNRFIWLRSTGSTVVSQLIDSYIVLYVGFVLPGKMSFGTYMSVAPTNYILKLIIAVGLTPLIYLGHYFVRRYLNQSKDSSTEITH